MACWKITASRFPPSYIGGYRCDSELNRWSLRMCIDFACSSNDTATPNETMLLFY